MTNILFSWEWGAGAGHLRLFAPIAEHLVERGHDVTIVSRDLSRTLDLFPHKRMRCLQCPAHPTGSNTTIQNPVTLSHLAWNLGLRDEDHVAVIIRAWRDLFDLIQPDVLITDFGLASAAVASAMGVATIRIGNGYLCPPCMDAPPLLDCVLDQPSDVDGGADTSAFSADMLTLINRALTRVGLPGEQSWRQLLVPNNRTLLCTIPPFDPYRRQRQEAQYLGFWDRATGDSPDWPDFGQSHAFAYLKPFQALPRLLTELTAAEVATAIVPDGISENQIPPSLNQFVRLQRNMVDLNQLGKQCRFGVCNATHGFAARLLVLGIPVLAIPLYLEHRLTARAIEREGCGVSVAPGNPAGFREAIERLKHDPSILLAAQKFAETYSSYGEGALARALEQLDALLASKTK